MDDADLDQVRSALEAARRQLDQVLDERNGEPIRRESVGPLVRNVTRAWSALNPDFDGDAWYPVSAMVMAHWDQIAEQGAVGSSTDGTPGLEPDASFGELCRRLSDEPLFGARELLHSNLLAWFIDAEPPVREVFDRWGAAGDGSQERTERERFKFDLLVRSEGRAPLVIENKTFSFPDDSQLERYTATAAANIRPSPTFALLSLANPGWDHGRIEIAGQTWEYRSYGELGNALVGAASRVDRGVPYERETLRRYGTMLVILDRLASIVTDLDPSSSRWRMPEELARPLEQVRLRPAFEKLRAHRIAQLLDATGPPPRVVPGLTRNHPLLQRYENVNDTDDEIGWQIQGRQFRLVVIVGDPGLRGPSREALRADYVQQRYGGYFDFDGLPLELADVSKSPWLHYNPGFVYRYRKVPDTLTIGDLRRLSDAAATLAQDFTKPDSRHSDAG